MLADEKNDIHLETLKLRFDILKHISTLSGVSVLVLLALAQTTPPDVDARLAIAGSFFGVATLISVMGLATLALYVERPILVRRPGHYWVMSGTASFATSVVFVLTTLMGLRWWPITLGVTVLGLLVLAALGLDRVLETRRARKRGRDTKSKDTPSK